MEEIKILLRNDLSIVPLKNNVRMARANLDYLFSSNIRKTQIYRFILNLHVFKKSHE